MQYPIPCWIYAMRPTLNGRLKMLLHIGLQRNLNCALCWSDSKYTHSFLYELQTQLKDSVICFKSTKHVTFDFYFRILSSLVIYIVGRLMQEAERRQQGDKGTAVVMETRGGRSFVKRDQFVLLLKITWHR